MKIKDLYIGQLTMVEKTRHIPGEGPNVFYRFFNGSTEYTLKPIKYVLIKKVKDYPVIYKDIETRKKYQTERSQVGDIFINENRVEVFANYIPPINKQSISKRKVISLFKEIVKK